MTELVEFAVELTAIDGLLVMTMKQAADERGVVREVFRASALSQAGIDIGPWRQVNVTETVRGAVRGIHAEAMNKLVAVASGTAFGVYVDLRAGSPTFAVTVTLELVPGRQVLVPKGVGNGFQATSEEPVQYLYCFDDEWQPDMPGRSCTPLDPELAIAWPIPIDPDDRSQISVKDRSAATLASLRSAP